MIRLLVVPVFATAALFALAGCGRKESAALPPLVIDANGKPVKPVPPLTLAEPTALLSPDGANLAAMEAEDLLTIASQAMNAGDYRKAAAYQHAYVQKSKTGQYNLACFLSLINKVDDAFYWLQQAALDEGVDADHAETDPDLASLRRDERWKPVHQFLRLTNLYFENTPSDKTLVILPKGYAKGTPIPVVLWMHGLGSNPENFVNEDCREYADAMNVAFVGVSGTKLRGPGSYVWAEEPTKDAARMKAALAEIADRVTVKPGHVITLGFSQGAQAGLDVAVRDPETYAGSIVLSPGAEPHLEGFTPSALLAKRGFVVSCGAKEHPGNVALAKSDADWLIKAKAKLIHKPYPGVSAHSFPRDFAERLPEWVAFILKARQE